MKNKRSLAILLALSLVLIGIIMKNGFTEEGVLIEKGDGTEQLVYETKLVALDQSETSLESYKDKVLVLNFWTSWCTYCQNEIPELHQFYSEQPEHVELLAINMTADESNAQAVEKFKEHYNVQFPIFLDERGFWQKSFEVTAFPMTVIIDASGIVRHRIQGEVTQEQLNEMLAQPI